MVAALGRRNPWDRVGLRLALRSPHRAGRGGYIRAARGRPGAKFAVAGTDATGNHKMVVRLEPMAERIAGLLAPHVERQGFELVSVEYHKGTRSSLLRLLVDRPGGGIGLDELERLSPVVGDLLDVYDPIEGRYTLEVASPGLNRPLVRLGDFEAVRGQRVRIKTHHAIDGRKAFIGVLAAVGEEGAEIDDEPSGRRVRIEFSDVKAANFEYDFDAAGRK